MYNQGAQLVAMRTKAKNIPLHIMNTINDVRLLW